MRASPPSTRTRRAVFSLLALAVCCGLLREITRHPPGPAASRPGPAKQAHTPAAAAPRPMRTAPVKPAVPNHNAPSEPAPQTFAALIAGRVPLRTESRLFQAQTWEPDLAKALDLPKNTPLQRRSALFHIPELKFPLVRVDRIYRMDRQIIITVPKTDAKLTGAAALDAPGGELLWDNAMIADHLMVQTQLGISQGQLQRVLPTSCHLLRAVNAEKGLYLVAVPADGDRSLERATLALNHETLKKTIWFAEPDFLMSGADSTPDDPLFTTTSTDTARQWALPRIMAPRAWDVIKQPAAVGSIPASTIANATVVAIVDTGVDYTHPDISPNLYANPGESGGGKETNGIDDDANGKIDDYRGWNFVEQNNNPMDDVGHGTHVAGIIGAAGNNNLGVTGVCWGVKMLPLRIIKKLGLGTYGVYSDAVAAMDYMRTLNSPTKRIAVANHSWGGGGYSLAMLNAVNNPLLTADPLPDGVRGTYDNDSNTISVTGTSTELNKIKVGMDFGGIGILEDTVITIISGSTLTLSNYTRQRVANQPVCFANPIRPKPYGIVHVAAAGNSRFNADRIPTYPASLPSGFMISVGASDTTDAASVWSGGAGSNYGRLNVDIFAPGTSIWSTRLKAPADPAYGYESRNGTSMAAPFVAGCVALLKMWQPRLSDLQARQIIIDNSDRNTALQEKCASGGRLNLAKVMDKLYQPILVGSGGSTGGTGATTQAMEAATGVTGRLSASGTHCLYVDRGEVWSWGSNSQGQLGQGNNIPLAAPKKLSGLTEVISVAACSNISFALKADGTVWAWGRYRFGVSGTGPVSSLVPVQIPGLSDITWFSALENHALAVRSDGVVFAWGKNNQGQLGDGTLTDRFHPVEITGMPAIIQAEAGARHSVALAADGTVYAWGDRRGAANQNNLLGDGNQTGIVTSPQLVPIITGIVFVEASVNASLFLHSNGTLWMTGNLQSVAQSHTPIHLSQFPADIRVVSVSGLHILVLDSEGKLYAAGQGAGGELGTGKIHYASAVAVPQEIKLPSAYGALACSASSNFSLILDADGRLYSTGLNQFGLLGTGVTPERSFPVEHPSLHGSLDFGGSSQMRYALLPDGEMQMWGTLNVNDSAGEGVTFQKPTAYLPPFTLGYPIGAPFVELVSPAIRAGVARLENGSVISWGNNVDGVLGVTGGARLNAAIISGLTDVTSLSAGQQFMLAVHADGSVSSWGRNSFGQLGDGGTTSRPTPATIPGLSSISQVVAGTHYAMALKSDGSVWAWGRNQLGQIGDGTTTSSTTPVQVSGLTDVVQIEAPLSSSGVDTPAYSLALKSDGSLYAWGGNGLHFPGSINANQLLPILIFPAQANKIVQVACARSTVVARLADGSLLSWGDGSYNPLGRIPGTASTTTSYRTPAPVFGGTQVVKLKSGRSEGSILFQKADGSVWTWGADFHTIGLGETYSTLLTGVVGFGATSSTLSSLGTGELSDAWLFQNFSLESFFDPQTVGDAADVDGDSVSNLMEYALGMNPNQPDRHLLPKQRLDFMRAQSASESTGGQVQLFSANDCCISTPVGLDADKHYMAFTVERRGGIRTDVDYIIEVSNDLVNWRSSRADVLTVINTGELLEAYSTTPIESQPAQFMRLLVRRK